jgi:hypothetical protein
MGADNGHFFFFLSTGFVGTLVGVAANAGTDRICGTGANGGPKFAYSFCAGACELAARCAPREPFVPVATVTACPAPDRILVAVFGFAVPCTAAGTAIIAAFERDAIAFFTFPPCAFKIWAACGPS